MIEHINSNTEENKTSDFNEWLQAMKMVAYLPDGTPAEFRRKLWLALSEQYLSMKNIDWETERVKYFSNASQNDDENLGDQIIKDLHRTGSSLCSGPAGSINQAKLKRILQGYARWNPEVGYCQGFNMLGALILQVMDKDEMESMKVMLYLIEGIFPSGYFSGSLNGLQIDMAVFRELMLARLPKLAKHLQKLQGPVEDRCCEPPLTNVFTIQWFITMFSTSLPFNSVLRIWDLVLIEGSGILLRTGLAIWSILENKILCSKSADDFYCKMGELSADMLNGTIIESNALIAKIVEFGPIPQLEELRKKHLTNIKSWTDRKIKFSTSDDDGDSDDEGEIPASKTMGMRLVRRRSSFNRITINKKTLAENRERIALDIPLLKKQYDRIREHQRQAHIILSAAVARQSSVTSIAPTTLGTNMLLDRRNSAGANIISHNSSSNKNVPPAVKNLQYNCKIRNSPLNQNANNSLSIAKKISPKLKKKFIYQKHEQIANSVKSPSILNVGAKSLKRNDSSSFSDSDNNSSTSTSLCDEDDSDHTMNFESSMESSPLHQIKNNSCQFTYDHLNIYNERVTNKFNSDKIDVVPIKESIHCDNSPKLSIDSDINMLQSKCLTNYDVVDANISDINIDKTLNTINNELISNNSTCDQQITTKIKTLAHTPINISLLNKNINNSSSLATLNQILESNNLVNLPIGESIKNSNYAFSVNESGVTNKYFERVNDIKTPTYLDLDLLTFQKYDPIPPNTATSENEISNIIETTEASENIEQVKVPAISEKQNSSVNLFESSEQCQSELASRIIEENSRVLHRILNKDFPPAKNYSFGYKNNEYTKYVFYDVDNLKEKSVKPTLDENKFSKNISDLDLNDIEDNKSIKATNINMKDKIYSNELVKDDEVKNILTKSKKDIETDIDFFAESEFIAPKCLESPANGKLKFQTQDDVTHNSYYNKLTISNENSNMGKEPLTDDEVITDISEFVAPNKCLESPSNEKIKFQTQDEVIDNSYYSKYTISSENSNIGKQPLTDDEVIKDLSEFVAPNKCLESPSNEKIKFQTQDDGTDSSSYNKFTISSENSNISKEPLTEEVINDPAHFIAPKYLESPPNEKIKFQTQDEVIDNSYYSKFTISSENSNIGKQPLTDDEVIKDLSEFVAPNKCLESPSNEKNKFQTQDDGTDSSSYNKFTISSENSNISKEPLTEEVINDPAQFIAPKYLESPANEKIKFQTQDEVTDKSCYNKFTISSENSNIGKQPITDDEVIKDLSEFVAPNKCLESPSNEKIKFQTQDDGTDSSSYNKFTISSENSNISKEPLTEEVINDPAQFIAPKYLESPPNEKIKFQTQDEVTNKSCYSKLTISSENSNIGKQPLTDDEVIKNLSEFVAPNKCLESPSNEKIKFQTQDDGTDSSSYNKFTISSENSNISKEPLTDEVINDPVQFIALKCSESPSNEKLNSQTQDKVTDNSCNNKFTISSENSTISKEPLTNDDVIKDLSEFIAPKCLEFPSNEKIKSQTQDKVTDNSYYNKFTISSENSNISKEPSTEDVINDPAQCIAPKCLESPSNEKIKFQTQDDVTDNSSSYYNKFTISSEKSNISKEPLTDEVINDPAQFIAPKCLESPSNGKINFQRQDDVTVSSYYNKFTSSEKSNIGKKELTDGEVIKDLPPLVNLKEERFALSAFKNTSTLNTNTNLSKSIASCKLEPSNSLQKDDNTLDDSSFGNQYNYSLPTIASSNWITGANFPFINIDHNKTYFNLDDYEKTTTNNANSNSQDDLINKDYNKLSELESSKSNQICHNLFSETCLNELNKNPKVIYLKNDLGPELNFKKKYELEFPSKSCDKEPIQTEFDKNSDDPLVNLNQDTYLNETVLNSPNQYIFDEVRHKKFLYDEYDIKYNKDKLKYDSSHLNLSEKYSVPKKELSTDYINNYDVAEPMRFTRSTGIKTLFDKKHFFDKDDSNSDSFQICDKYSNTLATHSKFEIDEEQLNIVDITNELIDSKLNPVKNSETDSKNITNIITDESIMLPILNNETINKYSKYSKDENINDRLLSIKNTIKSIDSLCDDTIFNRISKKEDEDCIYESKNLLRPLYNQKEHKHLQMYNFEEDKTMMRNHSNLKKVVAENNINRKEQFKYYNSDNSSKNTNYSDKKIYTIPPKLEIRHTTVTSTLYDRILAQNEERHRRLERHLYNKTTSLDVNVANSLNVNSHSAENSPLKIKSETGNSIKSDSKSCSNILLQLQNRT